MISVILLDESAAAGKKSVLGHGLKFPPLLVSLYSTCASRAWSIGACVSMNTPCTPCIAQAEADL